MELFVRKNRWAVLASGALIQLFSGIPAAWGAFQQGVEKGYGLDTPAVSLIFSFVIAAFGVGCVLGGALQDVMGARAACLAGAAGLGGGFFLASFLPGDKAWCLYLGFSLPVGLGCAFLYPAVMSCVQRWYPQKKGFATGVIGGAVGLSGAVLTFSSRWLIEAGGIRLCFRVLGCVMAALCALGALVMVEPKEEGTPVYHQAGRTADTPPQKLFGQKDYWLLLAAVACATPAILLFSPTILRYAEERGLSADAAALTIVIGSLGSAAGRLLMPWLSDHIGRRGADLILFGALGGFSALFAFTQGAWVIVVYTCMTFCYSGQAALLPAFATDRFGQRWAGINYGLLALGMSAGSVGFPFLARALKGDAACHWIAVAAAAAGFVCLLFVRARPASER